MQQKNPAANFFSDMQSTMKQMMESAPTANPFDFKSVMEVQRKNMQALTEANQCVMNGWQNLAKRQAEMVAQFVQDNSGLATQGLTPVGPQEALAKQTELLKSVCEQTMQNAREITEIVRKNTADATEIVNRRFVAGFGEIKNAAGKNTAE